MVTVLLPAKNVEEIIGPCLDSVAWADEVLFIDGNSTDRTLEIVARYPNTRVIQHPSKDIRVLVSDAEPQARNPWIFWLCADEIVTPELGQEILRRCADAPPEQGGFIVPSRDNLYGVPWETGQAFPRIWRKGRARFAFKEIHEMPDIEGPLSRLEHLYWHVNNPNLRTVIPKHLRYEYIDAQRASDEQCAKINGSVWRQLMRFNYYVIRAYWANRKLGFPAVANAFGIGFGQLMRHLLLVEELRIRQGKTERGTHGWG